jgi:hypothetical protein
MAVELGVTRESARQLVIAAFEDFTKEEIRWMLHQDGYDATMQAIILTQLSDHE